MEHVYFAKTTDDGIIPSKRFEDAGYDIYACLKQPFIIINPHETKRIPTGIASAFPEGYYFQLHERGSTGSKGIGQRCGVIDSGFRGEWFLTITNHNNVPLCLKKAGVTLPFDTDTFNGIVFNLEKALAQAILLPVPRVEICELSYEQLCSLTSERMFGDTGSSEK